MSSVISWKNGIRIKYNDQNLFLFKRHSPVLVQALDFEFKVM
jgi:hypothetical protein